MKKLLTLLIILVAAQVQAQTYYVSKGGNDLTGCAFAVNPATPKLTINAALACVGTATGAGANKVVEVGTGVYVESIDAARSAFPSGTSWTAPFILRAHAGDVVTIKNTGEFNLRLFSDAPFYAIVSGFQFDGTNLSQNSDQIALGSCCNGGNYVRLQNNSFVNNLRTHAIIVGRFSHNNEILTNSIHGGTWTYTGAGSAYTYPLYVEGSDNLIDGNDLYDFPSWGYHGYSSDPPYPSRNIIRNNKIHDYGFGDPTRASGVLVYSGDASQVLVNAIWNGTATPIGVGAAATNTVVQGNSFAPPSSPAPPVVTPPAVTTNWIDIRTDKTVTITGNQVSLPKDKSTNIIVNGNKR